MPTTLSAVNERSTKVITVSFTDEDGAAVVPNAVSWTLSDKAGTVINNRDAVALTPATSVTIVLSGDDLALVAGESPVRILTIEGTYTSSLGVNLTITDQASFRITNLAAVE